MKTKPWRTKFSLLLIAILIVLAGCTPVGTVDVGKAITNQYAIKSSEGKATFALELTADPAAAVTAEEKRALEALNGLKVELTDIKQQSLTEMSMKGTLEYSTIKIPFQVQLSDMSYTIQIEGAKKPIVIRNTAGIGAGSSLPMMTADLQKQMEELSKKAVDALPKLTAFFTNNFPNPKTISAEAANVTVNGEALQLQKLHIELKGGELLSLIKGFLTNVLADEEGLKQFIGTLYDLYAPFFKEMVKANAANGGEQGSLDTIMPFLDNKTLAVEFLYAFLKNNLEQALANFDETLNNLPKSEDGQSPQAWLNDNQSLKMDLYVDKDQFIRKSSSELLVTLPDSSESGLKSLKVTSTGEVWNINKPVTVDNIDVSGGVIEWANKSGRLTSSKLVASLDPKSDLYKLLKTDLNITKKEVNVSVSSSDMLVPGFTSYNDQGTVMVPARFVSEQLDADVEWDGVKKQVTITDPLSGNVTVLTIDSKQASVNGQAKTLEKAAVIVDGSTYIPVRFVAESMNAKVEWTQETQTVGIVRD